METIISVIAIVISVISVCFALYTFIWTVRRDRKQATLEAYNTLQNEAFDKINLYSPSEIQEFIKHPTSKEYNDVAALVARIEHFCVVYHIFFTSVSIILKKSLIILLQHFLFCEIMIYIDFERSGNQNYSTCRQSRRKAGPDLEHCDKRGEEARRRSGAVREFGKL